jgi:hypothetical protein
MTEMRSISDSDTVTNVRFTASGHRGFDRDRRDALYGSPLALPELIYGPTGVDQKEIRRHSQGFRNFNAIIELPLRITVTGGLTGDRAYQPRVPNGSSRTMNTAA